MKQNAKNNFSLLTKYLLESGTTQKLYKYYFKSCVFAHARKAKIQSLIHNWEGKRTSQESRRKGGGK